MRYIIFIINLLLLQNIFANEIYEAVVYNKLYNYNPSFVSLNTNIIFQAESDFYFYNEAYTKNEIDFNDKSLAISPKLYCIISFYSRLNILFNFEYDYSITNNFNKSQNFNLYETNSIYLRNYNIVPGFSYKLNKDLKIGFNLHINNTIYSNMYIENNKPYDYKYIQEIKDFKNIAGILSSKYSLKLGYCKKDLIDYYSDSYNIANKTKVNEFTFHIINIGVGFINYTKFLESLWNIELNYNIKTEQKLFTFYNTIYLTDVPDIEEKLQIYFIKPINNFKLLCGFKENYYSFSRYYETYEKKVWKKHYSLNFEIKFGIDFSLNNFMNIYLLPGFQHSFININIKEYVNKLILEGGVLFKIKEKTSIEIRNLPEIEYKKGIKSDRKNIQRYKISLIFTQKI